MMLVIKDDDVDGDGFERGNICQRYYFLIDGFAFHDDDIIVDYCYFAALPPPRRHRHTPHYTHTRRHVHTATLIFFFFFFAISIKATEGIHFIFFILLLLALFIEDIIIALVMT